MKEITFKQLTAQNFLSIGNDTIIIDFQEGLSLVTGSNVDNPERRNGSGKSSVIEAYYFALFGTTIRDIKKEFIINNVTKGKGRVELVFDVKTSKETNTYKIVRQIKPSKVDLYKLGSEDVEEITKDSIVNTNKYIQDLIGSNPVICKSCDILSLSDNIPFMAKKPEEKRKFIEDIFSIEVFGKMLKDLKTQIRDNKADTSISKTKIDEITNSIETLKRQMESHKKQLDEREEVLKTRKASYTTKIKDVKEKITFITIKDDESLKNDLTKYETGLKKVNQLVNDYTIQTSTYKMNIDGCKSKLKSLDSVNFGEKCGKCYQDIPTDESYITDQKKEVSKQMDKNIDEHSTNTELIAQYRAKANKIEVKIKEFRETLNENAANKNKLSSLKTTLESYERSLEELDVDLEDNTAGLKDFDKSITETEERLTTEQETLKELRQIGEDYDMCKFILGEEGVKSFMIKRLLSMLNGSIQKYITELGMTMRCKFDEYFDEQIANDKNKPISYWNLSGGERRTVDLACAWAFKDIKTKISGVSSNVEFLDEVFDSAFDERGLDLFIDVLKERITKNKLSCYTISHRKETLKHIDGETVHVEKENGITRRIVS